MSTAADIAKANAEKERLAAELAEVHMEIQRLEKKKAFLKDQIDPLLAEGERAGIVEKVVSHPLAVDEKLLAELEARFGPSVVKRSVNTEALRKRMKDDPEVDRLIPRRKQVSLRVGEAWTG